MAMVTDDATYSFGVDEKHALSLKGQTKCWFF